MVMAFFPKKAARIHLVLIPTAYRGWHQPGAATTVEAVLVKLMQEVGILA